MSRHIDVISDTCVGLRTLLTIGMTQIQLFKHTLEFLEPFTYSPNWQVF